VTFSIIIIIPVKVHIITEIISAITVPVKPGPAPVLSKHQKQLVQGLEGMLQENLRYNVISLLT